MAPQVFPCIDLFYIDIKLFMCIIVAMYVDIVPNRNSRPAILLREGWREGKRIRKRTIAQSDGVARGQGRSPATLTERRALDGSSRMCSSCSGHCPTAMSRQCSAPSTNWNSIDSSRRNDVANAIWLSPMIAEQLIHPSSKLGTTRLWHTTTLAQELGVVDADEDDLYAAMDWLIQRPVSESKRSWRVDTFPRVHRCFTM